MITAYIVYRKPRHSGGVQKRLTGEKDKRTPIVLQWKRPANREQRKTQSEDIIMREQDNVSKSPHTKWHCKYHIVFAPKYRRKVFYEEKRAEIQEILRTLCQWKGVEIVEGEICPDHIHLLLSIPPEMRIF